MSFTQKMWRYAHVPCAGGIFLPGPIEHILCHANVLRSTAGQTAFMYRFNWLYHVEQVGWNRWVFGTRVYVEPLRSSIDFKMNPAIDVSIAPEKNIRPLLLVVSGQFAPA
jgi:hypothetical protein